MSKKLNLRNRWHQILAAFVTEVWPEVGIEVRTDLKVLQEPPEVDFVLLRRREAKWTEEQRERLPDGIRDSTATHILIEFKYTESLNDKAVRSALGYDHFYRLHRRLRPHEVQTFLMVSKTPREATLTRFSYKPTEHSGIYHSDNYLLQAIPLLVLNELSDEAHNAFVKLFASRQKEKRQAAERLQPFIDERKPDEVTNLFFGLTQLWFGSYGEENMQQATISPPTPERIKALGREYREMMLKFYRPQDLIQQLTSEETAADITPEDLARMLKFYRPQDLIRQLTSEETAADITPEDLARMLKFYRPQDLIRQLTSEETAADITPEDLQKLLEVYKPQQLVGQLSPTQLAESLTPEQRKALREELLHDD